MKIFRVAIVLSAICISFSSCFKQTYDSPPDVSHQDPNLPCNVTIAQLSSPIFNAGSGSSRVFTGDSTIYGIVTADDRSGNFYHNIVIQDSTGGIVIGIQQTYLYVDYPIGRKVYIKLKGLTLVNYKGVPEIVYSATNSMGNLTVTNIPTALISSYITPASYPNTVTPAIMTLDSLGTHPQGYYINRLVEFDNMEFDSTVVGLPYALPSTLSTGTNRIVHDCRFDSSTGYHVTSSLILYNSGYASFQPAIIPKGKGSLSGIYSEYNSSPQFLIRDTSDIKFTNERNCP